MSSVNKIILVGNLGAEPELRRTQSGEAVCNLRVATNESWTDKSGQRHERPEWHQVVVWGAQADTCAKHLAKGRQLYVEGRLQSREHTDKAGVERRVWEVNARDVVFISAGSRGGEPGQHRAVAPSPRRTESRAPAGGATLPL